MPQLVYDNIDFADRPQLEILPAMSLVDEILLSKTGEGRCCSRCDVKSIGGGCMRKVSISKQPRQAFWDSHAQEID